MVPHSSASIDRFRKQAPERAGRVRGFWVYGGSEPGQLEALDVGSPGGGDCIDAIVVGATDERVETFHQVAYGVQKVGDVISLRVNSTPEEIHKEIYKSLSYSGKILTNKNL